MFIWLLKTTCYSSIISLYPLYWLPTCQGVPFPYECPFYWQQLDHPFTNEFFLNIIKKCDSPINTSPEWEPRVWGQKSVALRGTGGMVIVGRTVPDALTNIVKFFYFLLFCPEFVAAWYPNALLTLPLVALWAYKVFQIASPLGAFPPWGSWQQWG